MRILSSCALSVLFLLACSSGEGETGSDPLPQAGTAGSTQGGSAGASGQTSGAGGVSGTSGHGGASAGNAGEGGAGDGGAGGSAGDGGGAQAGAAGACTLSKPYSTKDQDCNDCAQEQCCAEVNACLTDTRCDDDYVNCSLACALLPDGSTEAEIKACLADCGTQHPEGKKLYDDAIGCVDQACATPCQ